jgi:cold shock CspA family protein
VVASEPSTVFGVHHGQVATFDDHVGAGTVTAPAGTWTFHCTSLADGSRTIAVDTPVTFRVAPGPVGFEALEVSPRSAG